jgi:hypothetical protein
MAAFNIIEMLRAMHDRHGYLLIVWKLADSTTTPGAPTFSRLGSLPDEHAQTSDET